MYFGLVPEDEEEVMGCDGLDGGSRSGGAAGGRAQDDTEHPGQQREKSARFNRFRTAPAFDFGFRVPVEDGAA